MTNTCPVCEMENAYFDIMDNNGAHYVCPDCGHEWCDSSLQIEDDEDDEIIESNNVMTKEEAHLALFSMWENGEVPSNFTEDHSEYERAMGQMMKYGKIEPDDFF
jgi:hypothetical protein